MKDIAELKRSRSGRWGLGPSAWCSCKTRGSGQGPARGRPREGGNYEPRREASEDPGPGGPSTAGCRPRDDEKLRFCLLGHAVRGALSWRPRQAVPPTPATHSHHVHAGWPRLAPAAGPQPPSPSAGAPAPPGVTDRPSGSRGASGRHSLARLLRVLFFLTLMGSVLSNVAGQFFSVPESGRVQRPPPAAGASQEWCRDLAAVHSCPR